MDVTTRFRQDAALYADLYAYVQSGEWETVFDSEKALWLRWNRGWLHAVAADDPEAARPILQRIPQEDAVVIRGCRGLRELAASVGFNGCNPCWQVVYEPKTPLPIRTELEIRSPDERDFPKVADSYELGTEEELREDFHRPEFLGGYLNGELVGYVGLHGEGSMGMLCVFPPWRRRGYAEALYGTLINRQLAEGRLPFAQILEDNEASLALQRKLGFTVSRELIYWIWKAE